jgi:hypothetical protein
VYDTRQIEAEAFGSGGSRTFESRVEKMSKWQSTIVENAMNRMNRHIMELIRRSGDDDFAGVSLVAKDSSKITNHMSWSGLWYEESVSLR